MIIIITAFQHYAGKNEESINQHSKRYADNGIQHTLLKSDCKIITNGINFGNQIIAPYNHLNEAKALTNGECGSVLHG